MRNWLLVLLFLSVSTAASLSASAEVEVLLPLTPERMGKHLAYYERVTDFMESGRATLTKKMIYSASIFKYLNLDMRAAFENTLDSTSDLESYFSDVSKALIPSFIMAGEDDLLRALYGVSLGMLSKEFEEISERKGRSGSSVACFFGAKIKDWYGFLYVRFGFKISLCDFYSKISKKQKLFKDIKKALEILSEVEIVKGPVSGAVPSERSLQSIRGNVCRI